MGKPVRLQTMSDQPTHYLDYAGSTTPGLTEYVLLGCAIIFMSFILWKWDAIKRWDERE